MNILGTKKLVTVIIPRIEGRRDIWFEKAVDSVQQQTYKKVQLLVECNRSEADNIAAGVKKAKGDIIHILHDDDMLTQNSIELAVEHMKDNDFLHGRAQFSDGGIYVPPYACPTVRRELMRTTLHRATMYYRKKLFRVPYIWDVHFHVTHLAAGRKLGYCPHILAYYRLHDHQLGKNMERKRWKEKIRNELKEKYDYL